MKSLRTTVLFAVIAGVMTYLVYQDMEKSEEEAAAKLVEGQIYPGLKAEKHTFLDFKGSKDSFTLKKEGRDWMIVSPFRDRADNGKVEAFVRQVAEQKVKELEVTPEKAKEYGLQDNTLHITMKSDDDSEHKVIVSRQFAYDGSSYLQKQGDNKVLLGDTSWKGIVGKILKDLRNRDLYQGPLAPKSLVVEGKNKLAFTMSDTQWDLKGRDVILDEVLVQDYLNQIKKLRIMNFIVETPTKEDLRKYGLNHPDLRIQVGNWWVRLKKKDGQLYSQASQRDTIYTMSIGDLEKLTKSLSDFRDKAFAFQFDRDKVSQVKLSRGSESLNLKKQDGGHWSLEVTPEGKALDAAKVDDLLTKISELQVSEFLPGSSKVKKTMGQVTLADQVGTTLLELSWGDKYKDKKDKLDHYKVHSSLAGDEALGVVVGSLQDIEKLELLKPNAAEPGKQK
jgi:hypothetical protein